MSNNHIELKIQPPRSKNQKVRLANNIRKNGHSEADIKRVVWHPENSPTKGRA